jgi:hypothetical protein
MADLAAHLTDDVLGGLPVRQWVLTLPHRLRYALAWDHELCRAVLGVFIRALLTFERRRAEWRGVRNASGGAVTAIQRFGSALNLNVHFHTLAIQGVFASDGNGGLRFVPNPEPSDVEVAKLLASISRRITRLAKRHGVHLENSHEDELALDPLASESPLLAGICGASVVGRIATGRRAGQPVLRLGRRRDAPLVALGGERQAHLDGFDLHANVAVPAGDRSRLEHLARYVAPAPGSEGRARVDPSGNILLTLRRAWGDGTRAVLFEPYELIEKLAALVPKPRVNLLLYHGVFGPSARLRSGAVGAARSHAERDATGAVTGTHAAVTGSVLPTGQLDAPPALALGHTGVDSAPQPPVPSRSRPRPHTPWAELLRRTFEIDVLACRECGGRLRLLATIEDSAVARQILSHLGLPTDCPEPRPARSPPGFPCDSDIRSTDA